VESLEWCCSLVGDVVRVVAGIASGLDEDRLLVDESSRLLRTVAALLSGRDAASLESAWCINSFRGTLALAAAVAVADLTGVQHGFWVAPGTLSVLRTSASSTGATVLRALPGQQRGS
jgi:uncharacterized membrane protein YccC